jgi:hypothetical protein
VAHDEDVVAQLADHGQVVRDEQVAEAQLALQFHEKGQDLRLDGNVERGDRLVADHEVGADGERAGDRHSLPLAAGQLAGLALRERRRQGDEVEQLADPRSARGAVADAEVPERLLDDPLDGEARAQRAVRVLVHQLEAPVQGSPAVAAQQGDVFAVDLDGPVRGPLKPHHHPGRGRLT